MARTDVEVRLSAKDDLSKSLTNIGKSFQNLGKTFVSAGKTIMNIAKVGITGAVVGLTAVVGGLTYALKKASDEQKEMAVVTSNLQNVAKNTGMSFDMLKDKTDKISQSMIRLGFDDEDTALSFSKLLGVTKDTAEAEKFLGASMDLARRNGMELGSVTTQMIMAMQGSGRVLKQLGIDVEDGASKMQIFGAIQKEIGGTAEQYANTFAGKSEAFAVAWENILEKIGGELLPIATQILDQINTALANIDWESVKAKIYLFVDEAKVKIEELRTWATEFSNSFGGEQGLRQRFEELRLKMLEWYTTAKMIWDTFLAPIFIPIIQDIITTFKLLLAELNFNEKELKNLWNWVKMLAIVFGVALAGALVTIGMLIIALNVAITGIIKLFKFWLESIDRTVKSLKFLIENLSRVYELWKAILSLDFGKAKGLLGDMGNEIKGLYKGDAVGGIVTPQKTYMVGERGAELFKPMGTGKIIPNNQVMGGSSAPLTLNVNVGVYAGTEVEKRNIAESLYKSLVQLAGMQNKSVAELLGA